MRTPDRGALTVGLVYVVTAALWIVLSGAAIKALPPAIEDNFEVGKGLAFVLVTGVSLYFIVADWSRKVRAEAVQRAGAERMLTQVIETVPVGVIMINGETLVTFLNPAAASLLGADPVTCIGRPLQEVCCANPSAAVRMQRLLEAGSVDGIEVGSGQSTRALAARSALLDPDEPDSGWIVALADMTESHLAGERTGRLLEGYRFLYEVAGVLTRASDERQILREVAELAVREGGAVAAWASLRTHHGERFEDAAVIGLGPEAREASRRLTEALNSDEMPESLASLLSGELIVRNDLLHDPANPWYSAAQAEGLRSSAALGLSAANGTGLVMTLFTSVSGYFDSEQVTLLQTLQHELAFLVDRLVLERRRLDTEEALAVSEQRYRQLFDANPQPMWVYDLETLSFLAVNDAAIRKYAYSAQEFKAMTIADIRPKEDVSRLRENVAHVASTGGGFEDAGIWSHADKYGRLFPVHIYSHTIEWDGRPAEVVIALEVARVE